MIEENDIDHLTNLIISRYVMEISFAKYIAQSILLEGYRKSNQGLVELDLPRLKNWVFNYPRMEKKVPPTHLEGFCIDLFKTFGTRAERDVLKMAPTGVVCIHDWIWSNNDGKYTCTKCNHWSYLGKEEHSIIGNRPEWDVPSVEDIMTWEIKGADFNNHNQKWYFNKIGAQAIHDLLKKG